MVFPLWPQILSTITFKSLFGQITKLSSSFVTFRVSRFPVSHLTYETVNVHLQNTLNLSKTTRVYFGVLQQDFVIPVSQPAERQEIPFNTLKYIPSKPSKIRMIPRTKPPREPSKPLVEPNEKQKQ